MKLFNTLFFLFLFAQIAICQMGEKEIIHEDFPNRIILPADIDGDGLEDIVSSSFVWYRNLGDLTFSQSKEIRNGLISVKTMQVIDFDGDGDLDLITGGMSKKVYFFENLGDGSFKEEVIISVHTGDVELIKFGDLDGDLDLDILVIVEYGVEVSWVENLGGGSYSLPQTVNTYAHYGVDGDIADLDGDGDNDILFASKDAIGEAYFHEIAWHENLGGGSFGPAQILDNPYYAPSSIFTDDIDLDGDIDIIAASKFGDKIEWIENLGGGVFEEPIIISADIVDPSSAMHIIKKADLDNDGDMDILSGSEDDLRLYWVENLGGGLFEDRETLNSLVFLGGGYDISVAAADFDGDGDLDVIVPKINEYKVDLCENLGGGFFEEAITTFPRFYWSVGINVNDIDGDGYKDIITASQYQNIVSWYKNSGDGQFDEQKKILSLGAQIDLQYLEDMNLDGDIDLFVGYGSRLVWFQNMGAGVFETIDTIVESITINSIAISDFDGDLDKDFFICTDDAVRWYETESIIDGNYTMHTLSGDVDYSGGASFADLNGDGYDDLVCVLEFYGTLRLAWYENMGDGSFSSFNTLSYVVTEAFKLGDLDNDGDIDVFYRSNALDEIGWIENLGDASFGDPHIISNEITSGKGIEIVDVDGDGDNDLVSTHFYFGDKSILFENIGGGLFLEGVDFVAPEQNLSIYMNFEDLDNDGYLEFIAGAGWGEGSRGKVFSTKNLYNYTNKVSGRCYFDINENGINDSLDISLPNINVISLPTDYYQLTDSLGNYTLAYIDTISNNTVLPQELEYWSIVSDSLSYTFNIDSSFTILDSLDFGFYPDTIIDLISIELTGSNTVCSDMVNYWINIKNKGTTIPSGTIHLELDDSIQYISSEIIPDSIIDQHIYWNYDSLFYFSNKTINLHVLMPSDINEGNTLTSFLSVTVDSLDEVVFVADDSLSQLLQCNFISNNKKANPVGFDSLGYIPDTTTSIEYTIHFQNTSNDTLIDITIVDYLDTNLIWPSFTVLASSHPVLFELDPYGKIKLSFNDINLIDSASNELESQGFITYQILIAEDVPVETTIHNYAIIQLGETKTIITDKTNSTLYDCGFLLENFNIITDICQNDTIKGYFEFLPENAIVIWSSLDYISEDQQLNWLLDTIGVFDLNISVEIPGFCSVDTLVFLEISPHYATVLDTVYICQPDSAYLFGEYQNVTGVYYDSLVKINGCDSLIGTELIVYPMYSYYDTVSICEGDYLQIGDYYYDDEGYYLVTLETINGCDSIVGIELNIDPSYIILLGIHPICLGDSVLIFEEYETMGGYYHDTLSTIIGCDSILREKIVIHDLSDVSFADWDYDMVCINHAPIDLIGFPYGGDFSGPGIVGSEFIPEEAGEGTHTLYYFYEDDLGCTGADTVEIIVDACLGIPTVNLSNITVFPNPFDDFTTIYFGIELTKNHTITINNALGQECYRNEKVIGTSLEIKKESLNAGIYLLHLFNPNSEMIYTVKLVVE